MGNLSLWDNHEVTVKANYRYYIMRGGIVLDKKYCLWTLKCYVEWKKQEQTSSGVLWYPRGELGPRPALDTKSLWIFKVSLLILHPTRFHICRFNQPWIINKVHYLWLAESTSAETVDTRWLYILYSFNHMKSKNRLNLSLGKNEKID